MPPALDADTSLDARFEHLAAEILSAEAALAARCTPAIGEPSVLATYERRRAANLPVRSFRRRAVRSLLDRARRIARPRRIQALAPAWPFGRLYAARAWGIELRPVGADAAAFDEYAWKRLVTRVASDLTSIGKIEQHFASREVGDLTLFADGEGAAFEQLVVDVLDDGGLRARHATLYEDFVEKTDLRVHFEGLERSRGARVQVSLSASDEVWHEKRREIRRVDELVILSPRSIAEAIVAADDLVPENVLRDVQAVLGTADAPASIVARSLRSLLVHALREPGDDLRGPIAGVPECVRTFMRAFVIRESLAATSALRRNEARRRAAA